MDENKQYSLMTLADGQQVLGSSDNFISVEIGIVTPQGTFGVEKAEPFKATEKEFDGLLDQAMTNIIEIDTITGKAQALMNTETPTIDLSPTLTDAGTI